MCGRETCSTIAPSNCIFEEWDDWRRSFSNVVEIEQLWQALDSFGMKTMIRCERLRGNRRRYDKLLNVYQITKFAHVLPLLTFLQSVQVYSQSLKYRMENFRPNKYEWLVRCSVPGIATRLMQQNKLVPKPRLPTFRPHNSFYPLKCHSIRFSPRVNASRVVRRSFDWKFETVRW